MEKLYEQDPFLQRFSARVLSCAQGKRGWEITLDRTAFFPEGGGQPWDTGRLGGCDVLEVHSRGEAVVHICSAPLAPGAEVEGEIDWPRRFDLMQQHSGEHIVSGIAHGLWGCENVGFHLGADVVTIDLSLPLDEAQLQLLEASANRYVWEDHPCVTLLPSQRELEEMTYRSKKALSGQVRIVTFPGADTCACCGTHVRSSGQVGLIKLLSAQKFREGVRIELVCGGRAWKYLNETWGQNHAVSNLLSAKPFQTAAAVERLLGENTRLKGQLQALEQQRIDAIARQYQGADGALIFAEGFSPDGLRRLCDAVLSVSQGLCACFAPGEDGSLRYVLGLRGGDVRPLVKELNAALSGRGGGKPDFAQGSVRAGRDEVAGFFACRTPPLFPMT